MTTYNFSQISDFEFESLCRDLMQEELGLPLELFAPGPDRGIDIRYTKVVDGEQQATVFQCKRWAENSFSNLLSHLVRCELPKIRKLDPARYFLLTSVPLTPARKDKIVTAIQPWIRSSADVIGRDDLSGLLASHGNVERRHIKLWLTSTEVLDALLNSDIATRSEFAAERAQHQRRLWVPNPSFERAHEILEENHVCVISGAPGIGKTMLAEVLLAGYISKGYEPVFISEDIDEGDRAWRSSRRQVFHYDDFLGRVTYGELRLRKNEESRLARFMERVRNSNSKRFILTTREYILSEAMRRYEQFSDVEVGNAKSIVSMDDYTHLIRARILYNHLFFSDLPRNLKSALVPRRRYRGVIDHRNYNPRVIDHAVSLQSVAKLSPEGFVSNMIETLENPTRVWNSIFGNLPKMARSILRAVTSLPYEVLFEDVRAVVQSFSLSDFDPDEFKSSIGMVEGTFLTLREASPGCNKPERVVTIRDPSVRDYLWSRLETVENEADWLLGGAIFFEQCVILYEGQHHVTSARNGLLGKRNRGVLSRIVIDHEKVARRAIELIEGPSPSLKLVIGTPNEYLTRDSPRLERRAEFLVSVLAENQTSRTVAEATTTALDVCRKAWSAGRGSSTEGVDLLRKAKEVENLLLGDMLIHAEREFLGFVSGQLEQTEDFAALVDLAYFSDLFSPPHRGLKSWGSEFEDFLDSYQDCLLEDDDPDWIEQEMDNIRRVAEDLEADIDELTSATDELITKLRMEEEDKDDGDWRKSHSIPQDESAAGEVDALFQSLL